MLRYRNDLGHRQPIYCLKCCVEAWQLSNDLKKSYLSNDGCQGWSGRNHRAERILIHSGTFHFQHFAKIPGLKIHVGQGSFCLVLQMQCKLMNSQLLHLIFNHMRAKSASAAHRGNSCKIGHCFMMSCKSTVALMQYTNWKYDVTFISNKWETAIKPQGHVTTASLKQANKEYTEGHLLSACISKSFAHPTLKLHSIHWGPKINDVEVLSWSEKLPQSYKQNFFCWIMMVLHQFLLFRYY